MEVFMDDFLVHGATFENCLNKFAKVLQGREDTNLVLNWKVAFYGIKRGCHRSYYLS